MIVIGLDVHRQSVTAVAIDEAGRALAEKTIPVGSDDLLGWAAELDGERLWGSRTAAGASGILCIA
jgi:predicted NBD/HSP70 family sugar kinase